MEEWIIDLKQEWKSVNTLREQQIRERRCIYRVPKYIRDLNSDCYTPYVVSLGPYHHDNRDLKEMEKFKRRILGLFLSKISKNLEDAAAAIKKDVQELMDAYDGLDERWVCDPDSFVQLMVLDACFMLEYFFFFNEMEEEEEIITCFFDLSPVAETVVRDLMLLENQVPQRALEILADLGREKVETNDIKWLYMNTVGIKRLYMNTVCNNDDAPQNNKITFHFLDTVRISMILHGDGDHAFLLESKYTREHNPPTVTELVDAGIKIEKSHNHTVKFEKGALKLIPIPISAFVDSQFLNLMAYEKMKDYNPEFSSLVEFINCLVDSGDDVAILRRKGIINGVTGSDEEVVAFFSRMTKGSWPPKWKCRKEGADVATSLVKYCKRWQNRWLSSFKRMYLENPWAFISLLGAVFLLLLTVLGTVYTVITYYHSK